MASSAQALATTVTASGKNLAAALGAETCTKTVAALADKLRRLIGTLCSHLFSYRGVRPFLKTAFFDFVRTFAPKVSLRSWPSRRGGLIRKSARKVNNSRENQHFGRIIEPEPVGLRNLNTC
jgi:hypothetical protein